MHKLDQIPILNKNACQHGIRFQPIELFQILIPYSSNIFA